MCHSEKAFATGMQFDFQGIIVLMWGANIPLIYYSFECSRKLRIVYWTLTSFLATCCSIVTFLPKFSQPHLRPLRAATFGSLALSTFIPVVHGFIDYGRTQYYRIGFPWVIATLVLNAVGAGAYAAKVSTVTLTTFDLNLQLSSVPREMVPPAIRHLRSKPSDHAHYGTTRRISLHSGCFGAI